jgi:hypothetical protein
MEAFDWNVVIVGHWNRAILTPQGIGLRLFRVEPGTPIAVEVAMDGLAPTRVKHENLTVTLSASKLIILADEPSYINLDRAREIAVRAIDGLPETPLTAAGFNIRIRIDTIPDDLLNTIRAQIDNRLSDAEFNLDGGSLTRTIRWQDGVLNLNVIQKKDFRVELNFHRQSSVPRELVAWLRHPIDDVRTTVTRLFNDVIRIPLEELNL